MASKRSYQSITLYKDMAPQILELEKVEAGEILQAIMRYSCYGEDTDMSQYDRFVRSLWKTIKLKLDAGETHDREISETNRNNAMKRWEKEKGNATACDGMQSNKSDATACDGTTYTNTVTGTNSSTITISSTVTNTEQANANADSDSANLLTSSAAAESAEPSAGDLFSLDQIKKKVKSGKVDLSEEGVKAFYEQMQDDSWMLYGKPVEKRYLLRALREWARKHPEYMLEDEREENDSGQIQQKQAGNYKDIIEASIYKTAKGYISKRLFDENVGGHHCLIRDYCPKEAFLEVQLSYMADNWSVWPKTQEYVKKDPYLEE